MSLNGPVKIPPYCVHKGSHQGYVNLEGRRIYFGLDGQAETTQRYHQFIAEWMAAGCQLRVEPDEITVKEMIARYWIFAKQYYRNADGSLSTEIENVKLALRPVNKLYSMSKAAEFGPLSLRAVRKRKGVRMNFLI